MTKKNEIHKIGQASYGQNLSNIHKPPRNLYIRGNDNILNTSDLKICIVGSRKHSEYGKRVTYDIIRELAPFNPIIVSGLATGIDSYALSYACQLNLRCIAVLGSGLSDDVIYPQSNIPLAHQIIEQGGSLISEYAPSIRAQKWSFPLRNRIMAGLSDTIVIVEGNTTSGTLITARLGLEFGKTIVCVPGSIFSELSAGPLSLIEQGALPLTKPSDILSIHNLQTTHSILHDQSTRIKKYERCTLEEQAVLSHINSHGLVDDHINRDKLLEITKFSPDKLQIILVTLEIKGMISEKFGMLYTL